ncbi:TetR/AcrR family transcriptional regulator [Clostridium sp. DJ247]|uniref:TetR/AcrR family transcriptional regulator n=1 Tax=Clostridium sp. DJ247 TaxID=2726188 RepID=UPI0016257455|nr:TetR/AcrR family transcriptional regulator [Clostridium sp. DJ247]MBC2580738.1 TetR/AcrR family transcriptional regulator [Clostridium sp. DJ247]
MSLYKQQKELIRKRIFDTSISLFREKGYEFTTIDEITKTLGIAKGTFYNFFNSKREVLFQWSSERFVALKLDSIIDNNETIEENLLSFFKVMTKGIMKEEKLFNSYIKELLIINKADQSKEIVKFENIHLYIIEHSKDLNENIYKDLDIKIRLINTYLFYEIANWFEYKRPLVELFDHLKKVLRLCLYGIF